MSIETKLFLSNALLFICFAVVDINIYDGAFADSEGFVNFLLTLWAAIFILSMPAWIIYLIWS